MLKLISKNVLSPPHTHTYVKSKQIKRRMRRVSKMEIKQTVRVYTLHMVGGGRLRA